jgi:hypothetical protein
MHQRMNASAPAAQCFFLPPHAHHLHASSAGRCHADARHDSKPFLDDLSIPAAPRLAEVLSLSRTRTPHAVSSAPFVFIDRHMIRTRRHFFISRQFFQSIGTPFVLCDEEAQQAPRVGSLISRRRNMIRIMHAAVS